MKKVLGIIICLVLCVFHATAEKVGGTATAVFCVKTVTEDVINYVEKDGGKVAVTTSSNTPSNNDWGAQKTNSQETSRRQTTKNIYMHSSPNPGCIFEGWAEKVDGSYQFIPGYTDKAGGSYTSKDATIRYSAIRNNGTDGEDIQRYAIFTSEYFYKDYATAEVIAEAGEVPGWVYVTMPGGKAYGEVSDAEWALSASCGSEEYINASTFTYNYYAKANDLAVEDVDDYKFVGWYKKRADGTEELISGNPSLTYTHQWQEGQDKKMVPPTFYAKFEPCTLYYFDNASARVIGETNGGSVCIQYNDEITWSCNNDIVESDGIRYQKDLETCKVIYTTENLNDGLYAFLGWFTSEEANNPISLDSRYEKTYSATVANNSVNPVDIGTLFARYASYYYRQPAVYIATDKNDGRVYVAMTNTGAPEVANDKRWSYGMDASDVIVQKPGSSAYAKYNVYYYAIPHPGAEFKGWSTTIDGSNIISKNAYYVAEYQASSDSENPHLAAPLYAVFEASVDVKHQDRMICYVNEQGIRCINDARIIVNLPNTDQMTAKLVDDATYDNSYFNLHSDYAELVDGNLVFDATQGAMTLVLTYNNNDLENAVGKRAKIRVEGKAGTKPYDIVVTVEEAPTITFLPAIGNGAYTIKHTNGNGKTYTMLSASTENIYVPILQESMATMELSVADTDDTDGLTFAGWQLIDGNNISYVSYEESFTYDFVTSVAVRPVFLRDDRALFTILTVNDYYTRTDHINYFDLQEALDVAASRVNQYGPQVVVFSNKNHKEGVLLQGNYNIPSGVTLLIPGVGPTKASVDDVFQMDSEDDRGKYVYRDKGSKSSILTRDDYVWLGDAPLCYRKLELEDNTTINVLPGGAIDIYAVLTGYNQIYEAIPYRYGQIVMGENCEIILHEASGEQYSALYAFGFVTGPMSSRVTALEGSIVHEVFQYTDPRGGMGLAHLYAYRNDYKVFPFSQYHIQNIEVPLELQYGAIEYVTTVALIRDNEFVLSASLIIPQTNSTSESGLFRLGENTSLIKYYDPHSDRLVCEVVGTAAELAFIKITLGNLYSGLLESALDEYLGSLGWLGSLALQAIFKDLVKDLQNVVLDSREYVMPITSNMDVIVRSGVTFTLASEFAFLAGSTLNLEEGATLNLQTKNWTDKNNVTQTQYGKLYFYDADENLLPQNMRDNTSNTYGDGNGYFAATKSLLLPLNYTPNNTQKLGNGEYKRKANTLLDSRFVADGVVNLAASTGLYTTAGGAQIISTKSGQINFSSNIANTTTKQAKYISNDISGLFNKDGINKPVEYSITSAILRNANGEGVQTSQGTYNYNPQYGIWTTETVTEPNYTSEVLVTLPDYNITLDGIQPFETDFDLVAGATSVTTDIVGATVAISDDKIHFSYNPQNKVGKYEGTISQSDSEGAIAVQRIQVIEDYTPDFNVTTAAMPNAYLGYKSEMPAGITTVDDNVSKYLCDWSYTIIGANADEFSFVWGDVNQEWTNAKVVFTPKTLGNKEASLVITATYTDANNVECITNKTISLTPTANTPNINDLDFAVDNLFEGDGAMPLFQNGTGNGMPITITLSNNGVVEIGGVSDGKYSNAATIKPIDLGVVDVLVEQPADWENGKPAISLNKTIYVTEDVVWNWDRLYFGTTNTDPVSVQASCVVQSIEIAATHVYDTETGPVTSDGDRHDVVTRLEKVSGSSYKNSVSIAGWEEGETEVWFTVTYKKNGSLETKEFRSMVYRDPKYLPINVNDTRIYEDVTWSQQNVEYNNVGATIAFTSSLQSLAQWDISFEGIPDVLSFVASGNNNWQIEESPNGINWSIVYTWAPIASGIPFELNLHPSSRFVRISYGAEVPVSIGVLKNVAISELKTVRADVDKLYMPIIDGGSVTKNVLFTYVSTQGYELSTSSNVFSSNPNTLPGLSEEPWYVTKRVAVNSSAQEVLLGSLNVDNTETRIPIQTYTYPQPIPIQLASDHVERYYYVTSETYKTTWNADENAVVMQNALADAAPFVIFHFADEPTPGVISFNFSETAKGYWVLEESADAVIWLPLNANSAQNLSEHFVMQNFKVADAITPTSKYVRVTYISDYAEVVELHNLSILPSVNITPDPAELMVFDTKNEKLTLTANNLKHIQFDVPDGFKIVKGESDDTEYKDNELSSKYVADGTRKSDVYICYSGDAAIKYATMNITTSKDAQGNTLAAPEILATIKLTGLKKHLPKGQTGIYTGTNLDIDGFDKDKNYKEARYRQVNTQNAFVAASDVALFDYVIIYGETTTSDDAEKIITPTSIAGSNAKTPCYIYVREDNNYVLYKENVVENANNSLKSWNGAISISDTEMSVADADPEKMSVYITGFCPYASTGYSKADEGVWYFKGDAGDQIDIYLEDCYIYSRYKSKRGNSFSRNNGETYSDKVARGSGAVLLFENNTQAETVHTPMNVTIHTRDSNVLKSHYGCLFESIVGRAFQISSPVQIYMNSADHYLNTHNTLTFDDLWPTTVNHEEVNKVRTNGFLSLQKQVNNAPSIDMGNKNTVVNFHGGRVELENACNSSDNYESTLAISYRTGVYGPAKFRFTLSHGIGTEGVDGRVNFYDGTTTVKPMDVDARYRQYYLMDDNGTTTSCLRSQKNTYVYGGSHCMMRACEEPTSKGGAPSDGEHPLGKLDYTLQAGDNIVDDVTKWVNVTTFPALGSDLDAYYKRDESQYPDKKYGLSSVTSDNGKIHVWIPAGMGYEVAPEVDQKISFWKASMTKIEASYGVYSGSVGGPDTKIEFTDDVQTEQVQNLLYCQIDENISGVIRGESGEPYSAPVLNPAPDGGYINITPSSVGTELQNDIQNVKPYVIEDRVYYVTTIPQADIWLNFTAPFNVENIYVVETYNEDALAAIGARSDVLLAQAAHNANFAAFFGVAIALESKKTFDMIYKDYEGWLKQVYPSVQIGGMQLLEQYWEKYDAGGKYVGSNWKTADYYLYKNTGDWEMQDGKLQTQWKYVTAKSGTNEDILIAQGQTYSMLFPYCTGCWDKIVDGDNVFYERDDWDYWSGKFLIFESTKGPHTIQGKNFIASTQGEGDWIFNASLPETGGKLMGNSTFATMQTNNASVYKYEVAPMSETYVPVSIDGVTIDPTGSFFYGAMPTPNNIRPKILYDGSLVYPSDGGDGNTTHIPTVGGGNDLFVTSIAGGINVAVAAPQNVRVLSSTGAVIYSGYVTTAVDIQLPTTGIYIVSGENEVQKILF